jgi:uncharacterized membrane protein YsdA (DUF1294 family)
MLKYTLISAAVFILWNLCAFYVYRKDKILAINRQHRISESSLLKIAFFGGAIGATASCIIHRHKTRKQPFANNLFIMLVCNMLAIGGIAGWFLA